MDIIYLGHLFIYFFVILTYGCMTCSCEIDVGTNASRRIPEAFNGFFFVVFSVMVNLMNLIMTSLLRLLKM